MKTPEVGTAEHAALITHGRHSGVQTAMAWLAFSHLPEPLQTLSKPIYMSAVELLDRILFDSAELTTALNRLVEAKDWMVRAGIRSDTGVPGPVPRPATVLDPPIGDLPGWKEPRPETLGDVGQDLRTGPLPTFPTRPNVERENWNFPSA